VLHAGFVSLLPAIVAQLSPCFNSLFAISRPSAAKSEPESRRITTAAGLQVAGGLDSLLQEIDPGPFSKPSKQEMSAWKTLDMNAYGLAR